MIATPDELSPTLAAAAHEGTSFFPGRRGASEQQGYADDVNNFYAQMLDICTNDAQRELLNSEILTFKQGYLRYYSKYLLSRSRCVSTMIAGPSNFPTHRMEKRSNAANNRSTDFLDWYKRATEAVKKSILAARTVDEKEDAAWASLRRDLAGSIETIRVIDEEGSYYTRSLFVNSIVGKVERHAGNGAVSLVESAVALVETYNQGHKKPAISRVSKFWGFPAIARAKAAESDQPAALSATLHEGEGVSVSVNTEIERVQIFFDSKPDEGMRAKLRGAAWNWSPSQGAWQRKTTDAARASAEQILGYGRFA